MTADPSARRPEPGGRSRRYPPELTGRTVAVLDAVEIVVHYVVAFLLLAIAAIVLYRTVEHLVDNRHHFTVQATTGINDLLFVVILMELLRTVVGHLETRAFRVRAFLTIGIISVVRHILSVGARLTLSDEMTETQFRHSQIELGVSAAVVLALALGLFVISRTPIE
jgi:uncharacterized membrane protein (DUF373 family)